MSSIDRRVVEARFDNKQFHEGVKGTLNDLSQLQKGLKMDGATKGLEEVSNGVNRLSEKFGALRVAGLAVLSSFAIQAANIAAGFAKSLTLEPIAQGFEEFELKMGSIQTIMAGSGESLEVVNQKLQELNEYSDKTIYSFADMTQNIGKFTNAGVSLDDAVSAIQGVANVAALSGANANEAARSMYNFAQAISTGSVKLIDWKSIELANMGTVEFKQQLIDTGVAMGTLTKTADGYVTSAGTALTATQGFNQSLTDEWLSAQVLTDTLQRFSDTTTDVGKRATAAATDVKTFSMMIDTMKESVGSGWAQTFEIVFGNFEEGKELWTSINEAFGNVVGASADARNAMLSGWKELGGRTALIDGLKNAVSSLISVMKPIKEAFRDIFPAMTGERLYEITVTFRDFFERFKMGGVLAENFKRTMRGLFAALGIGWEILKGTTRFLLDLFGRLSEGSSGILEFTGNIGDFLVKLHEAIKNGDDLTRFFEKLADVVDVPIQMIRNLAGAIADFFGEIKVGKPDLDGVVNQLDRIPSVGDLVIKLWGNIAEVMRNVWDAFLPLASGIADFFRGVSDWVRDAVGGLDVDYSDFLNTINTGLFATLVVMFRKFLDDFGGGALGDLVEGITEPFEKLTGTLGTMQNTLRATTLLQIAAAVGIMAAAVAALSKIDQEGLNRALGALTAMFVQLFTALLGMQAIGGVKGLSTASFGLILFATAIRVLVESVEELAEMSWDDLNKGLTGVAALLAAVTLAVKGMSGNTAGMFAAGAGLLVISAGIKVLASAVTDLADLSWEDMAKGLTGVGTLLGALALFTRFAAANKGGLAQGAGLILLAAAIKILASATEDLSDIPAGELAKGLGAITAILGAFVAFSRLTNPAGIVASGAALVLVSGAMVVMANALDRFGSMNIEEIGKGLLAMSGALLAVTVALNMVPPTAIFSATAITVVAGALVVIAEALRRAGNMEWEDIAQGLVALGGALLIIAVGVNAMSGAMLGAAALVVVAGALRILTPVLQALGGMSWEEIGKGLGTLAGAFVILGLAGLLLTPVVPTLFGLGAAVALLGVGVAAAGAGILALSVAFTALALSGGILVTAVVAIISALIGLIPALARQLGIGLVVFAEVIAQAGPAMLGAMSAVFKAIIDAINENIPGVIELFFNLSLELLNVIESLIPRMAHAGLNIIIGVLRAMAEKVPEVVNLIVTMGVDILRAITKRMPEIVRAGVDLIVSFIRGISNNIGRVIDAGADLIVRFVRGISRNAVKIVDAGFDAVIDFLNGIARSIRQNSDEFREAGLNIADAIVDGLTGGLSNKVGEVARGARNLASTAWDSAMSFLDAHSPSRKFMQLGEWTGEGMAIGMVNSVGQITSAAEGAGSAAVETMRKSISGIKDVLELDTDMRPKVTPVIDLSEIRKGAAEIGSTIGKQNLSIDAAFSKAKDASERYKSNLAVRESQVVDATPKSEVSMTYIQNNTSPKALSSAEIYRQTKNQLSQTKGALTPNATQTA